MLQNLPSVLTTTQAMDVLRIHRNTLLSWARTGKVTAIDKPANTVQQRRYLFNRDEILSLLSDEEQQAIKGEGS